MELHPVRDLFHEGDVVYLGANQYEISAFNEDAVSLRNVEFPLFGKEYSRAELEERLKENPDNDHLKAIITKTAKKAEPAGDSSQAELLEQAKTLIDEFCNREFETDEGADYTDLSNVKIAFTTTEDEQHYIQAIINLVDFRV